MTRGRSALVSRLTATAVLVVMPVALAAAQSIKLNGQLAQSGGTGVQEDYAFSPDGTRMVFRANPDGDSSLDLFSAPADASTAAVRLSSPHVSVDDFAISTLGWVAFIGVEGDDYDYHVYSVPIEGGASPMDLSAGLGDTYASDIAITPDGTRALFLAYEEPALQKLYSVPVDGSSPPTRLDADSGIVYVYRYWIGPDGSFVLFAKPFSSNREQLYRVAVDGSSPATLLATSRPAIIDFIEIEVEFSADGLHAIFRESDTDKGSVLSSDLFSVPVDGSHAPVPLNLVRQPGSISFQASSSVDRVLYTESGELFSIAVDGTQRRTLTPPGWRTQMFELTPDGTTVVFAAYREGGGMQDRALFRAPVEGDVAATQLTDPIGGLWGLAVGSTTVLFSQGQSLYALPLFQSGPPVLRVPRSGFFRPPILLNGPFVPGQGIHYGQEDAFRLTPDEREVVFINSRSPEELYRLEVAPVDGSRPAAEISAPMSFIRDVTSFQIAPGGQHVAYLADQRRDQTFELFRTSPAGGSAPVPYIDLPGGPEVGDVSGFQVSNDGELVVYRADQEVRQDFGLYQVSTDGHPEPALLAPLHFLTPDFVFSPSADHVVFRSPRMAALYSVRTGPDSTAIQLDSASSIGPHMSVSADGTWVVYQKHNEGPGDYDLWSAPIDGRSPARRLHPDNGIQFNTVTNFQTSPDGRSVVYTANHDFTVVFELYSVPIDGSASPVKLNPPLSGNLDVGVFQISPDGARVAYLADQRANNVDELFSVPISGRGEARRLNATLISAGDVTHFAFTPDGRRVVYRADQTSDARFELFSVRSDGRPAGTARGGAGSEPDVIRLTALAGTQSVQPDFLVGLDGLQVVYRADANVPGRQELFSVPSDGSTAPVRLSGALVPGGSVQSFALSPDKRLAVYLADQRADDVLELFSVPLLGGAAVALDLLPTFADVDTYRIDPESRSIVYRADRDSDGVPELFRVPIDGNAPAERLNGPLVPGGEVESDFSVLPGGRVVYRADEESNDVFELFLARSPE